MASTAACSSTPYPIQQHVQHALDLTKHSAHVSVSPMAHEPTSYPAHAQAPSMAPAPTLYPACAQTPPMAPAQTSYSAHAQKPSIVHATTSYPAPTTTSHPVQAVNLYPTRADLAATNTAPYPVTYMDAHTGQDMSATINHARQNYNPRVKIEFEKSKGIESFLNLVDSYCA